MDLKIKMERQFGLTKLKRDSRDFSHHRTFGSVGLVELPKKFLIEPLNTDNQLSSFFCTAFSSSSVGEDQWGQTFSPEYQAAKIGQLVGYNLAGRGTDLRSVMKAGVKIGFLPLLRSPFTLRDKDEKFIGEWLNWPSELDKEAANYKMSGYYSADGLRDIFDDIRMAMWMASQDPEDSKRSVVVGIKWFQEWTNIGDDGLIPENYSQFAGFHAIRIIGWETIGITDYLIAQNSYGEEYGDKGKMYFSRKVANREFTEGAFLFRRNPSPDEIKTISLLLSAISKLVGLFSSLIDLVIKKKTEPEPIPKPKPEPTPEPKPEPEPTSTLREFSEAIKVIEGWFVGSRSWRNLNPGNLKYTELTKYLGAIGKDNDNFCIFPSYEIGFWALCRFVKYAAENKLKDYKDKDIYGFFAVYAPTGEITSGRYAEIVAKKIGVLPITKLSDFI